MADPSVPELPPKYYLANFHTVLQFVEQQSGFLLAEREKGYLSDFRNLSEDAQCMYVRMTNRKGIFFRPSKFNYAEIEDIAKALGELDETAWTEPLWLDSIEEAWDVLSVFTKPELLKASKAHEVGKLSALKKDEIVLTLIEFFTLEELVTFVSAIEPVVRLRKVEESQLFLFLFFGDTYSNMTEFVIRDIGHMRFESYRPEQFAPRFKTPKEVKDAFWVHQFYQAYKSSMAFYPVEEVYDWVMGHKKILEGLDEVAVPRAERLLLKLGKELEREKLDPQALKTYRMATRPPARERQVRLLQKLDQPNEAIELCETIEKDPLNADELFFAIDFKAKLQKKKFRKSATVFLKDAPEIEIDRSYEHRVEAGALQHFLDQGYEGMFAENYPWRNLFGLLFWEIIFDPKYASIHNPLQRAPSDLYSPDFLKTRIDALKGQVELLKNKPFALNYLERVHAEKEGMANPFLGWHPETLFAAKILLHLLTYEQLRTVLLEIARDLKNNLTGFPDLLVWKEKSYQFLEVKSPNDQLSAQQLYWLRFFQNEGISANAINVKWGEGKI